MDRAAIPVLVEHERAVDQCGDERQLGDQFGVVLAERDRGRPGGRRPVQQVRLGRRRARGRRGGARAQFRAESRQRGVEAAQAIVARAQVQTPRAVPRIPGPVGVLECDRIGILLDEGPGVLREPGAGRRQQPAVLRRGRQHALHELEAERQRVLDEFRVVVGGVGRAGSGQRVRDPVGRESLHRTAGRRCQQHEHGDTREGSRHGTHGMSGPPMSTGREPIGWGRRIIAPASFDHEFRK